jgi:hypothetical protein
MPMPTDELLVAKADEVKNLLKGAFGTPPGYRPGIYLTHWLFEPVANDVVQPTPKV